MARLVKKFGGTSVADMDRIRNVAARVKVAFDRGDDVAVVVSAMSNTTDELVRLTRSAVASLIHGSTTWSWRPANRLQLGFWR